MDTIERDSPSLKGVFPIEYDKDSLDKKLLEGLVDIVSNVSLSYSILYADAVPSE